MGERRCEAAEPHRAGPRGLALPRLSPRRAAAEAEVRLDRLAQQFRAATDAGARPANGRGLGRVVG